MNLSLYTVSFLIAFSLYTADLLQLIKRHQLVPHAYADDTQIYGFCRPGEVDCLANRVSICIDEVSAWMMANRLQLNHSKTEVIWFFLGKASTADFQPVHVRIGGASILPAHSVRDLGVHLDADVSMKAHISATVRSCFAALRQIRSVRRSLPRYALQTLIRALVVSKVDYCNAVLAGISKRSTKSPAVSHECRCSVSFLSQEARQITPLLRDLHWLRIRERIHFRLCVLVYRCHTRNSAIVSRREHSPNN